MNSLVDSPESQRRHALHEDPVPRDRRLRPGFVFCHFVAIKNVERRTTRARNHQFTVRFEAEDQAAGALQRGFGTLTRFGCPERFAAPQVDAGFVRSFPKSRVVGYLGK